MTALASQMVTWWPHAVNATSNVTSYTGTTWEPLECAAITTRWTGGEARLSQSQTDGVAGLRVPQEGDSAADRGGRRQVKGERERQSTFCLANHRDRLHLCSVVQEGVTLKVCAPHPGRIIKYLQTMRWCPVGN